MAAGPREESSCRIGKRPSSPEPPAARQAACGMQGHPLTFCELAARFSFARLLLGSTVPYKPAGTGAVRKPQLPAPSAQHHRPWRGLLTVMLRSSRLRTRKMGLY